jgi:glutathione synthase/RimK-type ligase-like ATP-grasp enzyme
MTPQRVALVTAPTLPEGMEDTRDLLTALREAGAAASLVIWDDENTSWDDFDAILLHSPWDYSMRLGEFTEWLAKVGCDDRLLNSYPLITWNVDKRYLIELRDRGIALPETRVADRGADLAAGQLAGMASGRIVVKPVIGAGGRRTWLCSSLDEAVSVARAELRDEPVLIQEYEQVVESEGEYSAIYLDGVLSHLVLKVPRPGEFRVQNHYGGRTYPVAAEPWMDSYGRRVLAALPNEPIYGRIDFVIDESGDPKLMEIEVVEPDLFLRYHPESYRHFARTMLR